jgi:hypothetical protein
MLCIVIEEFKGAPVLAYAHCRGKGRMTPEAFARESSTTMWNATSDASPTR